MMKALILTLFFLHINSSYVFSSDYKYEVYVVPNKTHPNYEYQAPYPISSSLQKQSLSKDTYFSKHVALDTSSHLIHEHGQSFLLSCETAIEDLNSLELE